MSSPIEMSRVNRSEFVVLFFLDLPPKRSHNTDMADPSQELRVEIKGLMLDPSSNVPIVILRDSESQLFLPIWISQT